jgi:hypothetical protein
MSCGIRPVLLDFGAARRVISDHTQALTAILKPSFAPIEQYAETSQLRQGPWTDLYGLAAVLHYCVTGRTPVPATARAVHDDLPSLRLMAPALEQDFGQTYSPALLATIDRALSVRPDDRPSSITAWRECLIEQPRTVDLSRPSEVVTSAPAPDEAAVSGDAPVTAQPRPVTADSGRDVWTERTVVVSRPPGADSFEATQPQGPQFAQPMSDLFLHPRQAASSRVMRWGAGALLVAGVVALAAWSFKHEQSSQVAQLGSGTQPVVLTEAPTGRQVEGLSQPSVTPLAPVASQATPRAERSTRRKDESARKASRRADGSEPVRVSASAPLNPRQACGGRIFIAMAVCMKRYCSRPAYSQHGECVRMRAQEAAQMDSQRPYP